MKTYLLFLFPAFGDIEPAMIPWTEAKKLEWSDFSGFIPTDSKENSSTWSNFDFNYNWIEIDGEVVVQLETSTFFDPSRSWVKKDAQSKELLQHEQVHFNISELQSRYFKQEVYGYPFAGADIEEQFESLFSLQQERLAMMQEKYEQETDHGRNKEEQARWTKFVNDELKRMNEFD
jgi:hypothetical protein